MGWIQNANKTVTDERTGMVFASTGIGESLGYGGGNFVPDRPTVNLPIPKSGSSPGGIDSRARDLNGNLKTNQTKDSQFWMDAGYVGAEPDLATKAVFSDAQYAYTNAQKIAQNAINNYGRNNVSPAVQSLAVVHAATPVNVESPQIPPSMDRLMLGLDTGINWVTNNLFVIAIVIGAILLLPHLLGMLSAPRTIMRGRL
jgi:hypothetical protein